MKRLKNTKKSTIIVLVILFILLVCVVTVGNFLYKNRNSMLAVYYAYTNKTDTIEQDKQNTDEKALNAIKEFGVEEVRPLTEEEAEQLNSGEMSEEEAVDLILGRNETTAEATEGEVSAGNEQPSIPSADISAKNEEIAQLIGNLYVLKAKFTSELASIEKWVKDEYWKYTLEYGEGNVPSTIKTKIGKSAYSKALDLEESCDSQVEDILNRITVLLSETGQSTNIVTEVKEAYENEKMLAKTQYMSQI